MSLVVNVLEIFQIFDNRIRFQIRGGGVVRERAEKGENRREQDLHVACSQKKRSAFFGSVLPSSIINPKDPVVSPYS